MVYAWFTWGSPCERSSSVRSRSPRSRSPRCCGDARSPPPPRGSPSWASCCSPSTPGPCGRTTSSGPPRWSPRSTRASASSRSACSAAPGRSSRDCAVPTSPPCSPCRSVSDWWLPVPCRCPPARRSSPDSSRPPSAAWPMRFLRRGRLRGHGRMPFRSGSRWSSSGSPPSSRRRSSPYRCRSTASPCRSGAAQRSSGSEPHTLSCCGRDRAVSRCRRRPPWRPRRRARPPLWRLCSAGSWPCAQIFRSTRFWSLR